MTSFYPKTLWAARALMPMRRQFTSQELKTARQMARINSSYEEIRAALGWDMPTPSFARKLKAHGIRSRRWGKGVRMHYGVEEKLA